MAGGATSPHTVPRARLDRRVIDLIRGRRFPKTEPSQVEEVEVASVQGPERHRLKSAVVG